MSWWETDAERPGDLLSVTQGAPCGPFPGLRSRRLRDVKVLPSLGLTGPSWDVTLIVHFILGPRVAPLGWGWMRSKVQFLIHPALK